MRIAAIFSSVRNNKPRKSTYEEIIDEDEDSSPTTNLLPNGLKSTNGFKYFAVLIFAAAFLVLVVCLSFESNTVKFEGSGNVVLAAAEDVIVELEQGSLRGKRGTTRDGREYLAFLGIPYAKPPLGELRFKPPEAPDGWTNVLNATEFRAECIQNGQHDGSGGLKGAEDCLYLNVFTPKTLDELSSRRGRNQFPVLFYIHGGGHAGNIFPNKPDYILDENVVLVTLHYRLGILGTLNTMDAEARGNQGLKDQAMALKWVKNNIRKFGGDPNKVTLFGNSYGSIGVSIHLLSPMSTGLFHRAICQSGSILDPGLLSMHPREDAFSLGERLNCTSAVTSQNSTELISCFRQLKASDLVMTTLDSTLQQIFLHSVEPPSPTGNETDVILPDQPLKILQGGKINKVPVIFGTNSAEGIRETTYILNIPQMLTAINENFEAAAAPQLHLDPNAQSTSAIVNTLRDFYFGNKNVSRETRQNLTDMFSDRNFVHPSYVGATFQLNNNNSLGQTQNGRRNRGGRGGRGNSVAAPNVYLYYLTKQVDVSYFIDYQLRDHFNITSEDQNGAGHVDELQFLFPYNPPFPIITQDSKNYNFSKTMVRLWTTFADTGVPTGADNGAEWLPIQSPKPYNWYQIDDEPKMTDFLADRMNLWDSFTLTDLYV